MTIDAILSSPALSGMRNVRQWLVYALVPSKTRAGKQDKIPLHYATGNPSGVNDPNTWTDPHTAAAAARAWGAGFGIGFCFTADCGFWFVDLDSCYDPAAPAWSPLATQTCQVFAGAAVEVSSSGKGLHLFGRGTVPAHASKNADHHAELYHTDRFAALTGTGLAGDCNTDHSAAMQWFASTYFPPKATGTADVPDDEPRADWRGPADDEELLRRAMQSRSAASVFGGKASFADLWTADAAALARAYRPDSNSSEPYDRSSADAGLCAHLAFWTGCDAARMERLARRSALARDKWDDREDYLVERTIGNACRMQREVLQDKRLEVPTAPATASSAPMPQMKAAEGQTFLGPAEQMKLFEGCVYVVDQHRVLVPGGKQLRPDQFKAKFGGYSFSMDARNERVSRNAFEAFTESQVLRAPKVDGTCFKPRLPYGTMVEDPGRTRVNTYWPVVIPRIKGDVTPFLHHVRTLLPVDRDRDIALANLAACVQHQGVKFPWAIVLQGVEGNGKTILSQCAAFAVGKRYVHWPKASKLSNQFNGWMVGNVLYCVEDIFTGTKTDVLEELKPMITGGDGLEIEGKGVDQISAEICGNFIFNTNHPAGIKKTRNDRRFCWLATAQQSVADLARDGLNEAYFVQFNRWLNADGYAIVAEFLWTYPIPDDLNPATGCPRAPRTSSTEAAIEQSLGRAEQEVLAAAERGDPGFAGGWASTIMLDRLLDARHRDRDVAPKARGAMLEALGYVRHPALEPTGQVHHAVAPDGAKPKLYLRKDHESLTLIKPSDVAKAYVAAQLPHGGYR